MGTEIRHLSRELHPVLLREAGLTAALCSYCEDFSSLRGIPISCETDESVDKLPCRMMALVSIPTKNPGALC
jgi:signal transduction histidine kinase